MSTPRWLRRRGWRQRSCPRCHAKIGRVHHERCPVARCLATALQRTGHDETCPCPEDTWSGRWPGAAECFEYGWTYGDGLPDFNRLMSTAAWDPVAHRWIRPVHQTSTDHGTTAEEAPR
ncbi:hypothetical protein [Amycolatopsis alba]|uniref:Uncharacterized protein n=1 Tax=Amycolatopsis alba DSM 44262 TaxID=1125972 RepID=A0A229RCV7_AMYAL|nr:hypothetical protein [Amycolatopsis alba]OXM44502.1 hypothetical protein CFP75_34355 [Amycolatopsis alba DSM 44262]